MSHRLLVALLALTLPLGVAGNALANDNIYGDEYGNVILHEAGGPKIIFVGAKAARSDVVGQEIRLNTPVYKRASGPSVIYPAADPLVAGVIQGLSYRYGLDRNEIAILEHPGCQD